MLLYGPRGAGKGRWSTCWRSPDATGSADWILGLSAGAMPADLAKILRSAWAETQVQFAGLARQRHACAASGRLRSTRVTPPDPSLGKLALRLPWLDVMRLPAWRLRPNCVRLRVVPTPGTKPVGHRDHRERRDNDDDQSKHSFHPTSRFAPSSALRLHKPSGQSLSQTRPHIGHRRMLGQHEHASR